MEAAVLPLCTKTAAVAASVMIMPDVEPMNMMRRPSRSWKRVPAVAAIQPVRAYTMLRRSWVLTIFTPTF